MSKVTVTKIPHLNSFILKQTGGSDFFIATPGSLIMSYASFSYLLNFLLVTGMVSPKLLEGVLEEYYTDKGAYNV